MLILFARETYDWRKENVCIVWYNKNISVSLWMHGMGIYELLDIQGNQIIECLRDKLKMSLSDNDPTDARVLYCHQM